MKACASLRYLQQQGYDIPVVAMTAWSNTTLVVQAMQAGAGDFVEKPWNNQRLQQILQQQLKLSSLTRQNKALHQQLSSTPLELVWQSSQMLTLDAATANRGSHRS